MIRRLAVSALAGWALAIAPSALACPNCAESHPNQALAATILGLFMLVPFALAAVIARVVRNASRHAPEESDSSAAGEDPR